MNKTYGLVLTVVAGVILTLGIIFASLYGMRWFNSQTVQTQLIQPKESIECVIVSTTDSVAIDCWKIEQVDKL